MNARSHLPQIAIFGAGGHAKVVAESLRREGRWHVAGFLDDVSPQRRGELFEGAEVLGGREALQGLLARGVRDVVMAVGDNEARLRIAGELAAAGFSFPPVIDPSARVSTSAALGAGCFVAEMAVVHAGARLGAQVIVNTGAIVEHDVVLGDAVHLSPAACLGGHAEVGALAWIGLGALVRDRVRVGARGMIGMGAVVVADVPDGATAYGVPARRVSGARGRRA